MKADIKTVDTILPALGVSLPVGPLSKMNMKEYAIQLDRILALSSGERQRLGELLIAAESISSEQLEEALTQQRRDHRKLGEILVEKGELTPAARDAVLEFQRRQSCVAAVSTKFALGNILVANGDITRAQLDAALHSQVQSGRLLGEELVAAGHASKSQVEDGLSLQRKLIAYALALAVGLAPLAPSLVPSAAAAKDSAALSVSVTVIANAKLQVEYQAKQIQINAADVARGYVEVPAAARFSVVTNSRSGYLLEFHPVGNLFESVRVGGLGNPVQFGPDGGTMVQRGPLQPNFAHELSFRFTLHPDAQPATYPWPLQLSVRAL